MNDNQALPDRLVKMARGLCSQQARDYLEIMPFLMRHSTLDELLEDGKQYVAKAEQASQALFDFDMTEKGNEQAAAAVIRTHYLASEMLRIYRTEVAMRQREAAAGVH